MTLGGSAPPSAERGEMPTSRRSRLCLPRSSTCARTSRDDGAPSTIKTLAGFVPRRRPHRVSFGTRRPKSADARRVRCTKTGSRQGPSSASLLKLLSDSPNPRTASDWFRRRLPRLARSVANRAGIRSPTRPVSRPVDGTDSFDPVAQFFGDRCCFTTRCDIRNIRSTSMTIFLTSPSRFRIRPNRMLQLHTC
jgi:hypothetical protein